MRLLDGTAGRAFSALAGAALDASRRSVPRRAWRLGVETLERVVEVVRPVENAIDACRGAIRGEVEALRIETGELIRTHNGVIDVEDLGKHLQGEHYLPPGCDRTWEGHVVLEIDVTHPVDATRSMGCASGGDGTVHPVSVANLRRPRPLSQSGRVPGAP